MAYPGRPRGPQPNGPQRPFFRPPRMGNPFGFEENAYQSGMGAGQRFPRPDTEEPQDERPVSPDPYAKGGKFYRPSSTTLSDSDSDRERETEALRMRLLSLENEIKRAAEEKQQMAEELERLRRQQQQPPPQPPPRPPPQPQTEARTSEQTAARDFVWQWSQGAQQRPPPPMRQTLNNTQSTMTGLANQFQQLTVDPVQQVLQHLGAQAQPIQVNQGIPQLHLAPAEEQHVKVMADSKDSRAEQVQIMAAVLAYMKAAQPTATFDAAPIIAQLENAASHSVTKLLTQQEQIAQVQKLASRYKTTVPMPLIEPEPPGFVRDRYMFDLRHIHTKVSPFDPEKNPDQCFAVFMHELNDIAEGQYLNESHWINMFQNLLKGEARKEFIECRTNKYTLNQTVEYLGQLYTSSKTIEDDKRELEAFARKPGEDLTRCMARYNSKIRKIQHLYTPVAFPAIQESKMLSGLFALITPKTKAYLDTESCKATIAGAPFKIESLIQMAHTYEKSYGEVPTMALTCGTNSVDLQRKITAQSSKIKKLETEQAQQIEANKKLDQLIQVASASFKRERSSKSPTSSKPAYSRSGSKESKSRDPDVHMTDVSHAPKVTYSDKKNRADQPDYAARADNSEEKIRKLTQRLREEYEKKKKSGSNYIPSTGSRSNSGNRERGRSTTPGPGPSQQARSGSNSSQKSGYSRSNSASSDKEAGVTRVSVDITHKSNYIQCAVCEMAHPPYTRFCPAAGNP